MRSIETWSSVFAERCRVFEFEFHVASFPAAAWAVLPTALISVFDNKPDSHKHALVLSPELAQTLTVEEFEVGLCHANCSRNRNCLAQIPDGRTKTGVLCLILTCFFALIVCVLLRFRASWGAIILVAAVISMVIMSAGISGVVTSRRALRSVVVAHGGNLTLSWLSKIRGAERNRLQALVWRSFERYVRTIVGEMGPG